MVYSAEEEQEAAVATSIPRPESPHTNLPLCCALPAAPLRLSMVAVRLWSMKVVMTQSLREM